MKDEALIHPLADVAASKIGAGSRIWQYVVIFAGARIGDDANICAHCLIEGDVVVGDRVTVKSGVQLWDGLRVEDDVFIGPNVSFTNDRFPRSKVYPNTFVQTRIEKGASLGAGAVILPGITIGTCAMVGAGSVVTKSVPPYAIVYGNPARITGYVQSEAPDVDSPAQGLTGAFDGNEGAQKLGVGNVTLHRMKRIADMRGGLSVGEFPKDIPFVPSRYFLVFNVPSAKTRGEHAHHQCHQFLICTAGSCSVVVDDGTNRAEVLLDSPEKGIYIPPLTWGTQYKYSTDAVLLVFASHPYDADDYIRDYSNFTSVAKNAKQYTP
jgi:UDP-2-acetamido-3-amino-2,3-dideoxy-glucuronate N-acetyltransferase